MKQRRIAARDLAALDFAKGNGLLPAIVQDAITGAVLMLGFMNEAALLATFERRRVVFYSRSRQRLWEKGETSGHTLELRDIWTDCDADTLLVAAIPHGPVCHTGTLTCFGDSATQAAARAPAATAETSTNDATAGITGVEFLDDLEGVIRVRAAEGAAANSYTAKLLSEGVRRCAQKVGEEGVEVALAAAAGNDTEVISESADLLYHLLVTLRARNIDLAQVMQELRRRHSR